MIVIPKEPYLLQDGRYAPITSSLAGRSLMYGATAADGCQQSPGSSLVSLEAIAQPGINVFW